MSRLIAVFVLAALTLVACGGQPSGDAVATAIVLTEAAAVAAQPTATDTPEPTATPVPSPTATATPEPLTPSGIFESLSPAVVRLESDGGFGSGVIIEGGYVLTNAHVVWPAEEVIVSLTDGTTLEAVPVIGVDLMADLAVLGPIETDVAPLPLADGEGLAIGDTLLLIGYPGDMTDAPRPTLTETLISRLREQEVFDITYFQVSAPVAGGQSGGIAVTMDGQVVGLTGNRITEAQYGLIASAADILPRLDALLAGEGGPGDGRGPNPSEADTTHTIRLSEPDSNQVFVADLAQGDEIEVTVDGLGDAGLFLSPPAGEDTYYADETTHGIERLEMTAAYDGPHFLVVENYSDSGTYTLESNIPWTPYTDPDDEHEMTTGESYEGVIDYPGDVDVVTVSLDRGEVANFHMSSLFIDSLLVLNSRLLGFESSVHDDDSGGGLFDLDAELTYEAPNAGSYQLIVLDSLGADTGGYWLQVREPYDGAPTPTAPEPTATPIASEFGEFARWESDLFPFAFAYPAIYSDQSGTAACPEAVYTTCLLGPDDEAFIGVVEAELGQPGAARDLDELATRLEEDMPAAMSMSFVGREDVVTAGGDPAVVLAFADPDRALYLKVFAFMLDSDASFNMLFLYSDPAMEEMVDFVFTTFEVTR